MLGELGTERERELDSEHSPDFNNMGLVIWAWAALHLSQQEQAAKACVHSRTRAHVRTHTHNLIQTRKEDRGKGNRGVVSRASVLHVGAKNRLSGTAAPCRYDTQTDTTP